MNDTKFDEDVAAISASIDAKDREIERLKAIDAKDRENERLKASNAELLAALKDMTGGWRYIRASHGDLYGVGWDRAQNAAEAAIANATKA